MTFARLRMVLWLAVLVALVAWMSVDARQRSVAAQSAMSRRAVETAERLVLDVLAADDWPEGVVLVGPPPSRHSFEGPDAWADAMDAARQQKAWDIAAASSEWSVFLSGDEDDVWLVQRTGGSLRLRPWPPLVAAIGSETGVVVGGDGMPFLPGTLNTGDGPLRASPTLAAQGLGTWGDVVRALVAMLAAAALVAEALRAGESKRLLLARAEARDAVLQRMSHELRTPAASVRSLSDALAGGAVESPEERDQFFQLIAVEADRLSDGIERLLRAARGEATVRVSPVRLDLSEWARGVAERWRARLPGLTVQTPDTLPWLADPERLDEAVEALLDNAAKYGGPHVVLGLEQQVDEVVVWVSDDGAGVPRAEQSRVLGRLERVEGQPDDPGGYGLGLWAAGEVARAHGGGLVLVDGNRFELRLRSAP